LRHDRPLGIEPGGERFAHLVRNLKAVKGLDVPRSLLALLDEAIE
jgi:hypothetical protein